jgi:protein-S-isoprenylcysteine O-methyltransferase Ste14
MDAKPHEGPGLPVHPPVLHLAALLAGIGLNHRWPLSPLPGRWGDVVGGVLIVLGVALMPPVLGRFRRAGTSFNTHKPASALITDGPYRFSRNPAYVALTLWYLGIGLLLNNGWVLLLTIPLVLVMDRWVIRSEERHLEARFGDDYRRYESSVRRWL